MLVLQVEADASDLVRIAGIKAEVAKVICVPLAAEEIAESKFYFGCHFYIPHRIGRG